MHARLATSPVTPDKKGAAMPDDSTAPATASATPSTRRPRCVVNLSIGFEQCSCDYGCEVCGDTGTTPYWRPSRWVEIMSAIVKKTDEFGGWCPGGRHGTYLAIGGATRRIQVDYEGSDIRSLRSIVTKCWATVDHAMIYTATQAGRDALERGLLAFSDKCERRGKAPRSLKRGVSS